MKFDALHPAETVPHRAQRVARVHIRGQADIDPCTRPRRDCTDGCPTLDSAEIGSRVSVQSVGRLGPSFRLVEID